MGAKTQQKDIALGLRDETFSLFRSITMRGFFRVFNDETIRVTHRYRWENGIYQRQLIDTCYPNLWETWSGGRWVNAGVLALAS